MDNTWFIIIIIACVIALGVWVTVGSKKKQWYLVYLANNDVLLLCRDLDTRWWRSNGFYLRFKDEQGNEVSFPSQAHWIIKMVSVAQNNLEWAKTEVKRIAESQAKASE